MILYFNKNGQLLEQLEYGSAPRVGMTTFQIFAYFNGIDIENYGTALIRLKRPDLEGSEYPDMYMVSYNLNYDSQVESSNYFSSTNNPYSGFNFNFDAVTDEYGRIFLLDTPGMWEASITLIAINGGSNVTGLVRFNVGASVSSVDEEPTELDWSVIERNIGAVLATKVDKNDGFYLRFVADLATSANNGTLLDRVFKPDNYVFDGTTNKLYKILTTTPKDDTYVYAIYELVTPVYYWADVPISGGAQTNTNPTVSTIRATDGTSAHSTLSANGVVTGFDADNITQYGRDFIAFTNLGTEYTLWLPTESGRLALLGDLNNYVQKTTTPNKIYGTSGDGSPLTYDLGYSATGYTIAYRYTNGRLKVGAPSDNNDATTKKYVDDLISGVKTNSFIVITDMVTYPTLESFLNNYPTHEEGNIYLYPVDPSESPDFQSGYHQYIWENNGWLSIGTTQIDLSDYYTKGDVDGLLSAKSNATNLENGTGNGSLQTKGNVVSGKNSVALGNNNIIQADRAFASGGGNIIRYDSNNPNSVNGYLGFASGQNNYVSGWSASAIGEQLKALNGGQFMIGIANMGKMTTLFEIGNGTTNFVSLSSLSMSKPTWNEVKTNGIYYKVVSTIYTKITEINTTQAQYNDLTTADIYVFDDTGRSNAFEVDSDGTVRLGTKVEQLADNAQNVKGGTAVGSNSVALGLGDIYEYEWLLDTSDHPEILTLVTDTSVNPNWQNMILKYGNQYRRIVSVNTVAYTITLESAFTGTAVNDEITASIVTQVAIGNSSTVLGEYNQAFGEGALAGGIASKAVGNASTALGNFTLANQSYANAFGDHTIATGVAQTAVGKYNAIDFNALFVVGYGTSEANRKSAFVVNSDGSATVGHDPVNSMDVATKQYADTKRDLTTSRKVVYATSGTETESGSGKYTQTEISYSQGLNSNVLVQRDTNYQILVPTSPSDNNHATSKKYVDDGLQNVREVAEGKCKTVVLSYNTSAPTTDAEAQGLKAYDTGEYFADLDEFLDYVMFHPTQSNGFIINSYFNSQNYFEMSANGFYIITMDGYVISQEDIQSVKSTEFDTGDIFLVIETDVPDRWWEAGSLGFYKMETTKVDLSNYVDRTNPQTISGTKTFTDPVIVDSTAKVTIKANGYNGVLGLDQVNSLEFGTGALWTNVIDYDLGKTGKYWRDLYLSRNITDGTYSTTVEKLSYLYDGYYGKQIEMATISWKGFNVLMPPPNATLSLETAPSVGYKPEYKGSILNTEDSAITLTFTGVSNIMCNDDNIVIVEGTNSTMTLPVGTSVEFSIVGGKMVAINWSAN